MRTATGTTTTRTPKAPPRSVRPPTVAVARGGRETVISLDNQSIVTLIDKKEAEDSAEHRFIIIYKGQHSV